MTTWTVTYTAVADGVPFRGSIEIDEEDVTPARVSAAIDAHHADQGIVAEEISVQRIARKP